MQVLLLLAALVTLAGIVVTIAGLRSAPMAHEDSEGFHVLAGAEAVESLHAAQRDAEEHEDAPGATPHAA